MGSISDVHRKLKNGKGKCSVPMWIGGVPGGFCENDAYGKPTSCQTYRDVYTGEQRRFDGKYNGYVPALACPVHGGPEKHEALNLCEHCSDDFGSCKGKPQFGTGKGNDNVYDCDSFNKNNSPKIGTITQLKE